MVFSTATLLNFLFAAGTRTTGKAFSAANVAGVTIKADAAMDVLRMNSLRVIFQRVQGFNNRRLIAAQRLIWQIILADAGDGQSERCILYIDFVTVPIYLTTTLRCVNLGASGE